MFGDGSFLLENCSRRGEYKSNKSSSYQSCNSNAISSPTKSGYLNLCKLVISHININSLTPICAQCNLSLPPENIISESKIYNNFPIAQVFNTLFWLNINKNGGGMNII